MAHAGRIASTRVPSLFLAALLAGGGCSAGGGGAIPDAGPHDAVFEVGVNLPDGCPPASGNELGIGSPCTMNGGECNSRGLQCSCDPIFGALISGIPCFCSKLNFASNIPDGGTPCTTAGNFCGTAQCCPYQLLGYYCLPNACLDQGACPAISGP